MATFTVTPDKTNYAPGEVITVTEVASGLFAGSTTPETLTGTFVLSDGTQVVQAAPAPVNVVRPPVTVVDYQLVSSSGRVFTESPPGTFKATVT
jgi:hypothetical protein